MSSNQYFRRDTKPRYINLIQRLQPTPETPKQTPLTVATEWAGKEVFNTDGIVEEAKWLFRRLFSWDYMGASEFEMGTCPYALWKMHDERNDYSTWSMTIEREPVARDKTYENIFGVKEPLAGIATLWIVSRTDQKSFIEETIRKIVADNHRTMERPKLDRAVKYPQDDSAHNPMAWLDINNGSFWSIDEGLARAMANIICKIPLP